MAIVEEGDSRSGPKMRRLPLHWPLHRQLDVALPSFSFLFQVCSSVCLPMGVPVHLSGCPNEVCVCLCLSAYECVSVHLSAQMRMCVSLCNHLFVSFSHNCRGADIQAPHPYVTALGVPLACWRPQIVTLVEAKAGLVLVAYLIIDYLFFFYLVPPLKEHIYSHSPTHPTTHLPTHTKP